MLKNNVIISQDICVDFKSEEAFKEGATVKITQIALQNFRGFESFTAAFHGKLTVIVGDNGAGKSSLLDSLSIAAGTFLSGFDGLKANRITTDDAMNKCYEMGSVVDLQAQYPVVISASGDMGGYELTWTRELNSSTGSTTTAKAKNLISIAADYQSRIRAGDKTAILPIISYYGTGRLWAQKKEKKSSEQIEQFSRLVGYTDCLAAESNDKLMMKWFEKMTIQEYQRKGVLPEFAAVKQAICKCYQGITGYSDITVQYNPDTRGLDILFTDTDGTHKRYPMKHLSDGYKNTLSMIADIAYRMAILNPQLLDDVLNQTPGIILIDEVDLHLHPVWQQRILKDLQTIFPAVQFIVSTHAPSVINSVRMENLLILSDLEQAHQPVCEVYGSDANSVLSSVMSANERPVEIKQLFAAFYQAVDEEDFDKAEQIYAKLNAEIGNNDPELTGARVTLDLETM